MPKLDTLFESLIAAGGSDLHLGLGLPPLGRVSGTLTPLGPRPLNEGDLEELLDEPLGPPQRTRLREDLDVEFSFSFKDAARFRARYLVSANGRSASFRWIPMRALSPAELGLPDVISALADRRSGLVVVAGPRSSGKSTTVGALVERINATRACHVLTVEAPLEFVHEPRRAQITQREIGVHAPSFAAAARSAVRDDVDVLVLSELRTVEAAEMAFTFAARGALVLTTVRAKDAVGGLDALLGQFGEAARERAGGVLGRVLAAVVGQRLLPGTSGGRIAAHEVLVPSQDARALIREGRLGDLAERFASGAEGAIAREG